MTCDSNRLRCDHRPQEGTDNRLKAFRLVIGKPVARASYLFDPKAWVKLPQLSRHFKGNNGGVPNDKQDRDADCTHQLMILRAGRRKNIPRT